MCYAIRIKSVIILKLSVTLCSGKFFNIVNPLCLDTRTNIIIIITKLVSASWLGGETTLIR